MRWYWNNNTRSFKGFAQRFEDTPFAWYGSRSKARKEASALIAMIPRPLAEWIGQVYLPMATASRMPPNCAQTRQDESAAPSRP
jgi:hypothetical protein